MSDERKAAVFMVVCGALLLCLLAYGIPKMVRCHAAGGVMLRGMLEWPKCYDPASLRELPK